MVDCEEATEISRPSVYGRQDEKLHAICPKQVSPVYMLQLVELCYYPHFKLSYWFSINQYSNVRS